MKKQVLFICGSLDVGGIERSLLSLLNSFDYDKYDVDLMLFSHGGSWEKLLDERCKVLPPVSRCEYMTKPLLSAFCKQPLIAVNRLTARLKYSNSFARLAAYHKSCTPLMPPLEKHYDAVISHFWPHDYAAEKVNADKKAAWIHTDFSSAELDYAHDEAIWSQFDMIAGVSEKVSASFCARYPSLRDKVTVIENIVPPDAVRRNAQAFSPTELDCGCKAVLSVGRFNHQKAFEKIPQACRIMKQSGASFKWYIIGYGGDEAKIRAAARENGVEDCCIILGKKPNPYPYMSACDVYVQPSRYEGKSVCVTEAQMLGKSVVATAYATVSDQITDGVDGVICSQSAEDIAKAVLELLNDDEKRKKLSANCLEKNYLADTLDRIYGFLEG